MIFRQPAKQQLDSEHARELDDSFFQSRPFGYFVSRISSLLREAHSESGVDPGKLGIEFASQFGAKSPADLLEASEADYELQVALDAFSVRHHAAESLVRLYHALTVGAEKQGDLICTWSAVAEGPTKTVDLVDQSRAFFNNQANTKDFWRLVLPEAVADHSEVHEEVNQSLDVMVEWLFHAMSLLVREDININAANNKIKHGLAVRPNAKLLVTLSTQAPDAEGNVPLSALTGDQSFNVLEGVTAEYLARPRPSKRSQGLEMTVLNLRPVTMLTETWLMATTHAAMFHVAAAQHFNGRDVKFQSFPSLPLNTTPARVLGGAALGLRYPATTPPDGGPVDRKSGIAFPDRFMPLNLLREGPRKGVVVED